MLLALKTWGLCKYTSS